MSLMIKNIGFLLETSLMKLFTFEMRKTMHSSNRRGLIIHIKALLKIVN